MTETPQSITAGTPEWAAAVREHGTGLADVYPFAVVVGGVIVSRHREEATALAEGALLAAARRPGAPRVTVKRLGWLTGSSSVDVLPAEAPAATWPTW